MYIWSSWDPVLVYTAEISIAPNLDATCSALAIVPDDHIGWRCGSWQLLRAIAPTDVPDFRSRIDWLNLSSPTSLGIFDIASARDLVASNSLSRRIAVPNLLLGTIPKLEDNFLRWAHLRVQA